MEKLTITHRSKQVLKSLIERYLREGLPVGSKSLANEGSFSLSSATIRNILCDLEEKGFLASKHSSAGRVPTELGLRFFVDSLLTLQPPPADEIRAVKESLKPKNTAVDEVNVNLEESLINRTSGLLSQITQLVGIVSVPRHEQQILRLVEFIPLSKQKVLVILVLNEEKVQNRIIHTQKEYSASELEQAANYLNSLFIGKDLLEIRNALLDLLRDERENLDKLMRTAIDVAAKAFEGTEQKGDYVLAGESNLLSFGATQSSHQLRKIFEAFTQKQEILHLLDQSIKASGIQIFIGEETGELKFQGYSLITAPYSVGEQMIGALGVIGPMRMPYDRVIPVVSMTAKLLSAALNEASSAPI